MLLGASINYLSVFIAAIAALGLGAIWYGPLFGQYWMKLMGFTPKSVKKMKLSPFQAMAIGFVSLLVTSFVMAHFVVALGATTISAGIILGGIIWVGFLAPLLLGSFLWEGKSIDLWVFNSAHRLVEIVLITAILAGMH